MPILIVSDNPLFKEVIIATVAQFQTELIDFSPEEALFGIRELRPDVIILDEKVKSPAFEALLAEARGLEVTHVIVLNTTHNEIILMDSRRATLRRVDDLIETIAGFGYEVRPWSDDSNALDVNGAVKNMKEDP